MNDDVDDLESMLGRYRPAAPNSALRGRIVRQAQRNSRGVFLEAMAAILLLGVSLGQIGASVTQFVPAPRIDDRQIQQTASAISHLDLGLSPQDTQAIAVRLASADRLTPIPSVHGRSMSLSAFNFNFGAIP
jgi:hypothetical protein